MTSGLALDPKLTAAGLGQAASIIIWVLLAAFLGPVAALGAETLVILVGNSGLLLSIPFGWFVPNAASVA